MKKVFNKMYLINIDNPKKLEDIEPLFKFKVVAHVHLESGECLMVCGLTNDADISEFADFYANKLELSAAPIQCYHCPIMAKVRDAELPQLAEMFKYTVMDKDDDGNDNILGFADSLDLEIDLERWWMVDNVSGKICKKSWSD